jgi:sec-independent protein translocase protein TatA
MNPLFAWFSPGPMEMLIIGIVAVLLFGKRLPEVGRSLGKGIVEFKKGINGVEDEIAAASSAKSVSRATEQSYEEPTAPKFEPPAADGIAKEAGVTEA